jgi:CRISPR-associated protein Csb3
MMGAASIPVDLLNPGQVFACLGLMEAAEILCGPCEGEFLCDSSETDVRFRLTVEGSVEPVRRIIDFLSQAQAIAIAPRKSYPWNQKWGIPPQQRDVYCAPEPDAPASLAVMLAVGTTEIPIEHWLDGQHNGRDNVKFWAGAGGYPGAALARDALAPVANLGDNRLARVALDPFSFSAPMSSSFRFDWRRDYVPLDAGFSLNNHSSTMTTVGYPLVELLAAAGLQNARPERPSDRHKLLYRYSVAKGALPTILARTVLGGGRIGFPTRTFRMRLGWPGQEGQARCIVDAREEENAQ